MESDEYLLFPNNSFLEFIDADDENTAPKTFDKLEVGKQYEVVVTNLSGLYR